MKKSELKPKREKPKPKMADPWLAMSDHLRSKSAAETRHWRYCDGCGKRFPERDMIWIDIQGWFCGKCQKKNC